MKKRIASLLLALLTALPLMACGIRAQELTRDIRPQALDTATDLTAGGEAVTAFALTLLQNTDAAAPAACLPAVRAVCAGHDGQRRRR